MSLTNGATAELGEIIAKYTVTQHGPNPIDLKSLTNILTLRPWFEKALAVVQGTVSSGFRCPAVNAAVGGAPDSRHLYGLALDIQSAAVSANRANILKVTAYNEQAFLALRAALPDLGPVRKLCWEPTWVHIDWLPLWSAPRATELWKFDGKVWTPIKGT